MMPSLKFDDLDLDDKIVQEISDALHKVLVNPPPPPLSRSEMEDDYRFLCALLMMNLSDLLLPTNIKFRNGRMNYKKNAENEKYNAKLIDRLNKILDNRAKFCQDDLCKDAFLYDVCSVKDNLNS